MTTLADIKSSSFTFSTKAAAESFNNRLEKPLWLVEVTFPDAESEFWLVRPKHASAMVADGVASYA